MAYTEMDPTLAWKAIEGYRNELAPEKKALDAFYNQFVCIKDGCGGALRKETVAKHAFGDSDTLVPRSVLRCTLCNLLFDPHSGILLERGEDPNDLGMPIIRPK